MKKKKLIAAVALVCMQFSWFSCTQISSGGGTPQTTMSLTITNPEWATPIGPPGTPNPTYSPGFELEITVSTLNSSNQAVYYWSKIYSYSHNDIVTSSRIDFNNQINIPSSGSFVVEYKLRSQDCTWPNSNCPNSPSFSRKYFRDQFTFTSNPFSYQFICTPSNKYMEFCC
jgi:hypothetical protein